MNVKNVSRNTFQRVFYKDAYLRTNRAVKFSAWNEFGASLFLNENYNQQIPDSGVYYYDFTTPDINGYVLVIATDDSDPQGTVLKVGNPTEELAFYLRGDLSENIITNYEIFNSNSTIISNGTMQNISSGFYKVNVDGLLKPWFIEVNETVVVEST